MTDIETELSNLYGAPLDQFTATRNELASRLEEAGDAEVAGTVKALKKPSVSAALVNHLVRQRPLDLARLLKSGEALEAAQRSVLAGEAVDLAAVKKEDNAAIRALVGAAKEVSPGVSAAMLDRVTQSLRAAATAAGRERLKQGRLTADLDPAGFEAYAGTEPALSARTEKLPNRRKALLTEKRNAAREKVKAFSAETRQLEKAARQAEAAYKKADLDWRSAQKRSELAEAELARVEAELAALR